MSKRKALSTRVKPKSILRSNAKPAFSLVKPLVFIAIIGLACLGYFYTQRRATDIFQIDGSTHQAYGIAAKLDGAGYFTVNNSAKINPRMGYGFVAEAWVKPAEATFATMGIFDKTYAVDKGNFRISTESQFDTTQNHYRVQYDFSVFQSDCLTYNSISNVVTYSDPSQVMSWHHVAGVLQPEGKMDIYVDGKKSTSTFNTINNLCTNTTASITIGAQNNPNINVSNLPKINYFKGEMDEIHVAQYTKYKDNFTPSTVPMPRKESTDFIFHLDGNLADSIKTVNLYTGVPMGSGVTFTPTSIIVAPPSTDTPTPGTCNQNLVSYSFFEDCSTKIGSAGKRMISYRCGGDTSDRRIGDRISCDTESNLINAARTTCSKNTCSPTPLSGVVTVEGKITSSRLEGAAGYYITLDNGGSYRLIPKGISRFGKTLAKYNQEVQQNSLSNYLGKRVVLTGKVITANKNPSRAGIPTTPKDSIQISSISLAPISMPTLSPTN